ncbi:F-box protein At3g07870-like [Papaver somniferum]|uniref:F-box protein At3g07870-like n=1 Tax=Papaver somniferum TaxID=3469 RepID=UPI000E6FAB1E|nr:F-box protein At3g07870-like [Papaver somniferum]XP_026389186.1 F-box protein At3g07870-like [Papaver somniferum]XP_026389187.1 F-box protein At3g07870-like [Papaver somniferum]XP_026389188.1 F-box protein At3g07870-like [Papaver somniferum]
MDLFNSLPEEITLDIISRLPTEDVLECKSVCTNWRRIVLLPLFCKMHLDHLNHPAADSGKLGFIAMTYIPRSNGIVDRNSSFNLHYFEFNENHESIERITRVNYKPPFGYGTRFVGLCNGLICLDKFHSPGKTYICNPITREYIMLPEINTVGMGVWKSEFGYRYDLITGEFCMLPRIKITKMDFGYVSSTNKYKVVAVMSFEETEFMEVCVYTLGSGNGWRNIGKFNFGTIEHWGEGVFVNGSFYWMDVRKIVTFDLAEEKFSDLTPPPLPSKYGDCYYHISVLDGCLSSVIYGKINEAEYWDVWLLKNKDDNHWMKERDGHQSMGWRKQFRVFDNEESRLSNSDSDSDSEEKYRLLNSVIFAVTKSCNVLIHHDNHINIHNPKASTSKSIMDFKENFGGVFPHKNTLVPLKELGEEDTKMMGSVEIEETESHAQPFNQLLEDETQGKNILVEYFLNSVSLKELGEEDTKMTESVEIEEIESHAQPFNQLLEDGTLGTYL